MKKILFFIVAAFISTTMYSQLVTTTGYKVTRDPMLWFIRAGIDLNNVSASGFSSKSKVGFNAGVEFNKTISGGLYWGSGLGLGSKGYKYSESKVDETFNTLKIEIPLNFGYKFDIAEDTRLDVHVGGFANYDVSGTLKYTSGSNTKSTNIGDLSGYKRFGAGVQFGAGVWYQKFNFDITDRKNV